VSRSEYIFTSESVSEGHPDKVADQISDAVVDLFLSRDPVARVACETMVTTNRIILAGEVRCKADVMPTVAEIETAVRATVKRIGYEQDGFHWQKADFACHLHEQSAHIAQGVDESGNKDEGAGDQGIMFGYACDDTPDLMPATLYYSHRILEKLAEERHSGRAPFLEPDAKSQVTLHYVNDRPVKALKLVVSTQHGAGCDQKMLRDYIIGQFEQVLPAGWMPADADIFVNPTGLFEIGGPDGDAGLTGRKIIVDTYGGASPHGGGAFSGKDPTKVDRSAAYACRYLAKNVVAAGLARRCTIQISYAIGVAEPLSFYVDLHGTGTVSEARLEAVLPSVMRLTPKGIRTHLNLNQPIYERSAAYGHFGRTPDAQGGFSWEKTDLVDAIKAAL
jgi:S-adenosylmethionine synthetase